MASRRRRNRKKKIKSPILGEVASRALDIELGGFVDEILQPTDKTLRALGFNLEAYETLLRDHQVHSTFQQRRSAVVSRELVVEAASTAAADTAAADFLREQLEALDFDGKTKKMLIAIHYGYAVGEMLWARDGARIVIDDIKVRRQRRFRFDADNRLRLITRDNHKGLVMPARKFWVFSAGADDDEDPYGRGLGHFLYWPCYLKRNAAKFWAIALEKFGTPTSLAKYPPGATEAEIKLALEAAMSVSTEAAIALPDGFMVELLQSLKQSGGDFLAFLAYWDAAISKIVLSQTMTTDDGSSLAQGEVHEDVKDDVIKEDADLVCSSFNCGPAVWLTEWNFPGANPPTIRRRIEDEPDLKEIAERDNQIQALGFEPTEAYIKETYGDGWVRRKTEDPGSRAGAGASQTSDQENQEDDDEDFAEALAPDAVQRYFEDLFERGELSAAMAPIEGGLRDFLESEPSLEAARDNLAKAVAGMDLSAFGESVARAHFQAALAGEAAAPINDIEDEEL